ncbi:MAG: carbohydrate ABC transporter permease [Clostridiales bacterium]|jgi:putative aldouronate transport system permease protein|nr:carbohydrate ABC transporter permease [Clostridiales bacterium]MDD6873907.1 carbohydrate ABC transporter permease [Clostridiales bacterium]MDD7367097.1 carbohydrate ABC transporter permease [Clostridiales bacterium]MDY2873148.1 carbohydrate ABC transporter permease [Eubacteriales bacterium]
MSAKKKETGGEIRYMRVKPVTNVLFSLVFILLALVCFMPALLVLIVSFSAESSVVSKGYSYWPNAWSLESYRYLGRQIEYIGRAFLNSIGVTVVGTAMGLVLCSTMGYALSRPNYRLRKFFTWYIFIPMLFSGGLVASYMINAQILGLKNTYWALILPICCSSFYIIIMRTFFQTSVPDAIIESAKIDGARQIRIFVQIVLPISLPAVATIGLFYTFAYWNDWLMAKYYLNSNMQDLFPLQYVLISLESSIEFLSRNSQFMAPGEASKVPAETVRMAMVMIAVVPIACSYPFFQKYFISGLTIGAVKG